VTGIINQSSPCDAQATEFLMGSHLHNNNYYLLMPTIGRLSSGFYNAFFDPTNVSFIILHFLDEIVKVLKVKGLWFLSKSLSVNSG
jgi:hypothetical protein